MFEEGLAFDGSSIRGFQQIHESDMLLLPDVATSFVDPFRVEKTLALNFFIHDPFTREPYSRDPRNVAKKAETYLASSGIADTAYFGAEAEFYIFDSIRHSTGANEAYYYIDSVEGWWNSGKEEPGGNRGYKTAYKGGYFPVPPVDHYADLRTRWCATVNPDHGQAGTMRSAPPDRQINSGSPRCCSPDTCSCIKNTAWRRQERDVHAKAALRRQRFRHARTRACGQRRAALLRRNWVRRAVRPRPVVRRWLPRTARRVPANPTVSSYRRLVRASRRR